MKTKGSRFILLAHAAIPGLMAGALDAALIAYEDFDYGSGVNLTTETANNGSGWTAAWATTGPSGLTTSGTGQSLWFGQNPPLITDGSTHVISSTNRGNERDWNTTVDLATENLYFTALVHVFSGASVVDMRAEFWDGAGASGNMRGNVGITDGDLYVHASTGGYNPAGGDSAAGVLAGNTTYLLAMKRTTSGISASLITADGNSSTFASEPGVWQVNDPGASGVDLTSIRLIANGTDGGIRLDELRIATDWDSAVSGLVIPEPGSAALLGLGGLLLASRRRRAAA
ncbi:MAG: PEP-CTERM sorting domain-containing protein [Akkermansiaceae bacterium]|nr:PEP-CTERM sorting domain-containing protein [Akkermansiaceae bacterium]NNM28077.1 PEP-CTERM sorting domain-containing protein [Akkermansiaceae bacterium]